MRHHKSLILSLPLLAICSSASGETVLLDMLRVAEKHETDRSIISLLADVARSNNPDFNFEFSQAIEREEAVGCLQIVAGTLQRHCRPIRAGEDAGAPPEERAYYHLIKAADLGSTRAAFEIGRRLLEGKVSPEIRNKFPSLNQRSGTDWLKLASTAGYVEATSYLEGRKKEEEEKEQKLAEQAQWMKQKQSTNPNCSSIKFSGIAVGATYINLEIAHQQSDLEDHIARNPLRCSPNRWDSTYNCRGISTFQNHPAFLLSWTKTWLTVISPIDLTTKRVDAILFVDRSSARCVDHVVPSGDSVKNFERFYESKNPYNR